MPNTKFKKGEKVRVTIGHSAGLEGIVQWANTRVSGLPMYTIETTNTVGGYSLGETDDFGEECLELVEPDVREVGKKINPELVKIGDKIRAVRHSDYGIEDSRGGIVARIEETPEGVKFFNKFDAYIGWSYTCVDFILEEESTIHELTLKPIGTKFKATRGQSSLHYLIYTKVREGYWLCESFELRGGKFKEITVRSEINTINEFNKGRSEYID